jgi:RNA recognition motif-containing protein
MGFRTEEWAVREFFKSAGEITAVRIAYDRETERPKGFCHVEFADPASATKAVAELNGF